MADPEPWYTAVKPFYAIKCAGHIPFVHDTESPDDQILADLAERYPHIVPVRLGEAPSHPLVIFQTQKSPWTTYWYGATVYFAFQQLRDAIEFKLVIGSV